ncbi:class II aldolase/adducin family protein [Modestobacter sp. VKM Ac-2979]|uniref:class II aldolase/adducin family protein n=1 Tax=unclassified Modestobacter TaxID=2643866 RepID=UPI0022ABAFA3|nr:MULTISPECIES: class II aldolase/adducin family protein [unclassified Modestobacter]MCZ2811033.1 class II aldolase/adducin family protein [Modestobacter sp. VKM Ac-2979]MCZ2840546.1 class II aldolase/adducin family protein [Modestobacter sp. VKM Ac-2980]
MTATWDPSLVSTELVQLTRALGEPGRDLAILAEGNTSQLLDDGRVVVKASGSGMRDVDAEDFVVVDVDPLVALIRDPRSTQADLTAALDAGEHEGRRRRASIETLVHVAAQAFTPTPFVGHTHPTAVVALLASVHAATAYDTYVYSDEAVVIGRPLFVPYAQPGVELGRVYLEGLTRHWETHGELPQLVLLGNHGIVVNAPSAAGVEGVSQMAVKGAQVRSAAYAMGGVVPLPAASVETFFARDDIEERRRILAGGSR